MESSLSERPGAPGGAPEVSVIVPARNEEACLADCLCSLVAQQGVRFEIMVVDDGSTDRTPEIARSFPEVALLEAAPLPSGWCGKSNAVYTAARLARGKWLLFTDADTVHLPGSLARSLEEAKTHGAALLSYSPAQELHGFWQHAVMPVIFSELATSYRPSEINDPKSAAAAANGQYLLIARQAYEAVGGHAAVAASLLEDVELARAVKRAGFKLRFRFGGDAVRARMYRSFAQLCEGWTKNLALLFRYPLLIALTRLLEFLSIAGGLALVVLAITLGDMHLAIGVAIAIAFLYLNFLLRIAKAHAAWISNLLSILGLLIFPYLLLRSRLYYKWRRSVTWKGRQYATGAEKPPFSSVPRPSRSAQQPGAPWST